MYNIAVLTTSNVARHAQLVAVLVATIALFLATRYQWRCIKESGSYLPATWLSWAVVSGVTFTTLIETGANPLELCIPVVQLSSTLFLFVGTVCRMSHKSWRTCTPTWRDFIVLGMCTGGILLWQNSNNIWLAVGANVGANLAGLLPVLWDAWRAPQNIALGYWTLRGTSTLAAALSFVCTTAVNRVGLVPQLFGMLMAVTVLSIVLYKKSTVFVGTPAPAYQT